MPFSVNCPACREPLEVDEEYRAWKVRCPRCGHEFYPPEPADDPALATVPDDGEPRRRRREFDADDDPRRAAQEVSAPATALKALAWLGLVVSVFAVGIWTLIVVMVANDPQAPQNMGKKNAEELYAEAALYITQGTIAFVVSIIILIGAIKMSRLQSHRWATTAAVCGMIPCISPCCLLGMPFGIWALSVLNRAHIQAAFRRAARGRLRRSPDDHDDPD